MSKHEKVYFCPGAIAEHDCGKRSKEKERSFVLVTNVDSFGEGEYADIAIFKSKEQAIEYWQAGLGERGFDQSKAEKTAPKPIYVKRGVSHGTLYMHTSQPLNKPFDAAPYASSAKPSVSADNNGAYEKLEELEAEEPETEEPESETAQGARIPLEEIRTN